MGFKFYNGNANRERKISIMIKIFLYRTERRENKNLSFHGNRILYKRFRSFLLWPLIFLKKCKEYEIIWMRNNLEYFIYLLGLHSPILHLPRNKLENVSEKI